MERSESENGAQTMDSLTLAFDLESWVDPSGGPSLSEVKHEPRPLGVIETRTCIITVVFGNVPCPWS